MRSFARRRMNGLNAVAAGWNGLGRSWLRYLKVRPAYRWNMHNLPSHSAQCVFYKVHPKIFLSWPPSFRFQIFGQHTIGYQWLIIIGLTTPPIARSPLLQTFGKSLYEVPSMDPLEEGWWCRLISFGIESHWEINLYSWPWWLMITVLISGLM